MKSLVRCFEVSETPCCEFCWNEAGVTFCSVVVQGTVNNVPTQRMYEFATCCTHLLTTPGVDPEAVKEGRGRALEHQAQETKTYPESVLSAIKGSVRDNDNNCPEGEYGNNVVQFKGFNS